ncbi:WGR domain-containing protein [Acidisoma sp. S159]|uniref:WGR domain-containing protein n=1 Tax=Acidisoma sp. S159 TaxID=1747225 RepID=UPI0020B12379|nr:WGR domain-containing protein [Acidisoma sp. S159]
MAILEDGNLAGPLRPRHAHRQWGRTGTEGHRRLDLHPDRGAACNALAEILRAKRRRGYQDRT